MENNEPVIMNVIWYGAITDEQRIGLTREINVGKPDDRAPIQLNVIEKSPITMKEGDDQPKSTYLKLVADMLLDSLVEETRYHGFGGDLPAPLIVYIAMAYQGHVDVPCPPCMFFLEDPRKQGDFRMMVPHDLKKEFVEHREAEEAAEVH